MAQDRLSENLKIFESETDMRMSNLSKKQMSHFLSGMFYSAHGYFRFTSLGEGGITVFERQMFEREMFMHRVLQLVIKRCSQKKLDIEAEFDGAMQLAIAPVFHAHFSASNMMLMSGAEPLTSPQTKEMQRLTDAYTAYLPSRVAHVG
jgi:hypothetical protein